MRIYTYSEARQKLSEVLKMSMTQEVLITRKDGSVFKILPQKESTQSPFDVEGIDSNLDLDDILTAVKESRGEIHSSSKS